MGERQRKTKQNLNGAAPSAGTSDRPAEFERFEELTSKLLQVPKSEVDAKRKAAKA